MLHRFSIAGLFCLVGIGCHPSGQPGALTPDAIAAASADAGTQGGDTNTFAEDAGHRDGTSNDASSADASSTDALEPDALGADATRIDTGVIDAGAPDATPLDAGHLDAEVTDAGPPDSGIDDWGPCTVSGVEGRCIDVQFCDGNRRPTPGFCPGPANIQCCAERPPNGMCDPAVHVRAASFPPETVYDATCPAGMVRVDGQQGFCIDRYEAALVEEVAGQEQPWSPYHHPGQAVVRAVSLPSVVPQGYIDGRSAAAACGRAQKRLCTSTEWLRACQGASSWTYPYGGSRQPGRCNDSRSVHPAVELFPNDPNPFARIQNACINQLPSSLDETGDNSGCESMDGVFDMMGNLHEWVNDASGTFRGGFYVDTVINGNGCLYRTTAHSMGHWDYSTGFRCCAD